MTDTTIEACSARAGPRRRLRHVEPVGAGNPNDLLLKFVPPGAKLNPGDRVVTRGTVSDTDRFAVAVSARACRSA